MVSLEGTWYAFLVNDIAYSTLTCPFHDTAGMLTVCQVGAMSRRRINCLVQAAMDGDQAGVVANGMDAVCIPCP
jgi:hypothetical protein